MKVQTRIVIVNVNVGGREREMWGGGALVTWLNTTTSCKVGLLIVLSWASFILSLRPSY